MRSKNDKNSTLKNWSENPIAFTAKHLVSIFTEILRKGIYRKTYETLPSKVSAFCKWLPFNLYEIKSIYMRPIHNPSPMSMMELLLRK